MAEYVIKKFEAKNSLFGIQGRAYSDVFNEAIGSKLVSDYGYFCKDGQASCFTNEENYIRGRQWIIDKLKENPAWGRIFYEEQSEKIDDFVAQSLKLLKEIKSIPPGQLILTAKRFIYDATHATSLTYFTDWYSYKANEWIEEIVDLSKDDFLCLSESKKISFSRKYEIALAKLKLYGEPSPDQIEEDFFWVQDNYMQTHRIDREKIQHDLADLSENEAEKLVRVSSKSSHVREELIQKLNLNPFVSSIVELLSDFVDLQDKRKMACLITNNVALELFKRFLDYKKISDQGTRDIIMQNAFPYWITDLDSAELCDRSKLASEGVLFEDGKKEKFGQESEDRFNEIIGDANTGKITGFVAHRGKVSGRVKIIQRIDDFGKMESGDILVTSMTRPEMAQIMKKAAAFVTDEGGITCHAAIISRELGIPCIIGTKIATKVLKDGDLVEVDANKGVVRKISEEN